MPVVIGSSSHPRGLFHRLQADSRWVYLGKETVGCARISRMLGEDVRLPLGNRLHLVAEELRQPFLDFVAGVGKLQCDRLGWCSSTFVWKIWDVSDLFLLVCYEHVVARLVHEWPENRGRLVVVVEDPWLYRQLLEIFRDTLGVTFAARPSLWRWRLKSLLAGLVRRLWWAGKICLSWLIQRWHGRGTKSQQPRSPGIAIFSFPRRQCLVSATGWRDPYLDGLDRELEAAGFTVGRFSPPEAVGFERDLARRSQYFTPLIRFLTFPSLCRCMGATWRPVWPTTLQVGGLDVRWLASREWWWDSGRASQFLYRLFYESVRRFLQSGRWKLVVFPYENQPWEKLLVLAAQQQGVKTIGYQHAIVPRLFLSMFFGHGESSVAPIPDVIFTSGSQAHQLLMAGGTPATRLVLGGSRRYRQLVAPTQLSPVPAADPAVGSSVLVALPIDQVLTEHLCAAIRLAFPTGGRKEGIKFLFKLHPAAPFSLVSGDIPGEIVHDKFEDVLTRCDMVLFAGSTTGLEAVLLGRRVLRYRSELLLDLNHCEALETIDVPVCDDGDLREKLLGVIQDKSGEPVRPDRSSALREDLFGPVDEARWIATVRTLINAN